LNRKKKKMDLPLILLCAFLIAVIVVSSVLLYSIFEEYNASAKEYDALLNTCVTYHGEVTEETGSMVSLNAANTGELNTLLEIDWNALKNTNPDVIGYIFIPDTKLNNPIVHSSDNMDYLNTTFEGATNSAGCIFLDCNNHPTFTDYNSIVYGHSMKNGTMFRVLIQYEKESFYKEHPYIYLCTPDGNKRYGVLSVIRSNADSVAYTLSFMEKGSYGTFLSTIKTLSLYETGVMADTNKPTVTLSTCSGVGGKERTLLLLQELD